jgi:hypothetical protein
MKNKYGNLSGQCSRGHSHRSKLEISVCNIIDLREKAGEIKLIQVEDHVKLSGWYTYIADFKVQDMDTGEIFWIEAKGDARGRWPSTKKGWRHCGPGKLEVWMGDYRNPFLKEILFPKFNGAM